MELSSKLRHLELVLKPSRPLHLSPQTRMTESEIPCISCAVDDLADALIETGLNQPAQTVSFPNRVLLRWNFGHQGYLTFLIQNDLPSTSFQHLLQARLANAIVGE